MKFKIKINNHLCYRIVPEKFIELRDNIVELFPTQDTDFLYTPYYNSSVDGEKVSAQGALYNIYKKIRKKLRISGLLCSLEEADETKSQEDIIISNFLKNFLQLFII